MATCFDSIESSSGLLKDRSKASKFIVHFGIPECTINFDTLDQFFGRPDDDSIESKHVAIRIFCIINCCVWLKFIPRINLVISHLRHQSLTTWRSYNVNPLNPELNPICYLLALLAHHFLHASRIRVKSLTLRLLMSYIYGAPILDVSRSHTTTHHSR